VLVFLFPIFLFEELISTNILFFSCDFIVRVHNLVVRNFSFKVDKWDDRCSNSDPRHISCKYVLSYQLS
jgi:hypothetical protein